VGFGLLDTVNAIIQSMRAMSSATHWLHWIIVAMYVPALLVSSC